MAARFISVKLSENGGDCKSKGTNPHFLQIDGAVAHPPLGLSFLQCPSIHHAE